MGELLSTLQGLEFGNRILIFGAAMLLSVLPLVILLSAFASHRVDIDISRHLGLNGQGSQVVSGLFKTSAISFNLAILLSLVLSLAGTLAVARSVQTIYEDAFSQPHLRGARNLARCGAWVAVSAGLLIAEGAISKPLEHGVAGPIALGVVEVVALTFFFLWSMHFLLAGRASWTMVAPSAVATALFCVGLGVFASIYLSSTVVSDSRLYGSIGVVFSLVTWFIAIGAVIILGSVAGVVWGERRSRARR